jgi:hypothetical protein
MTDLQDPIPFHMQESVMLSVHAAATLPLPQQVLDEHSVSKPALPLHTQVHPAKAEQGRRVQIPDQAVASFEIEQLRW